MMMMRQVMCVMMRRARLGPGPAWPRAAGEARGGLVVRGLGSWSDSFGHNLHACFVVSPNGHVRETNISVRETIRRTGIQARDIVSLLTSTTADEVTSDPSLLVRDDALVISLGYFKCLIKADRALIFDSGHLALRSSVRGLGEFVKHYAAETRNTHAAIRAEDSTRGSRRRKKRGSMSSGTSTGEGGSSASSAVPEKYPFELVVLEGILKETAEAYERKICLLLSLVDSMATQLENPIRNASVVRGIVPLKDGLSLFDISLESVVGAIASLLASDEDMDGILVSRHVPLLEEGSPTLSSSSQSQDIGGQVAESHVGDDHHMDNHEMVELLLENYHRAFSLLHQNVTQMRRRIQHGQEIAAINLDVYRNRLMSLNLNLAMASVGLGLCTAVAGYYGMNVPNGWEEFTPGFLYVCAGSTLAGSGLYLGLWNYAQGMATQTGSMKESTKELHTLHWLLEHLTAVESALRSVSSSTAASSGAATVTANANPDADDADRPQHDPEFDVLKHDRRHHMPVERSTFRRMLEKASGERISEHSADLVFSLIDSSGNDRLEAEEYGQYRRASPTVSVLRLARETRRRAKPLSQPPIPPHHPSPPPPASKPPPAAASNTAATGNNNHGNSNSGCSSSSDSSSKSTNES